VPVTSIPTLPDRYYYPDLHNNVITKIDGQKMVRCHGTRRLWMPSFSFLRCAREQEPFAGALKGGTPTIPPYYSQPPFLPIPSLFSRTESFKIADDIDSKTHVLLLSDHASETLLPKKCE